MSILTTVIVWYSGFFLHSWMFDIRDINYGIWKMEGDRVKLKLIDENITDIAPLPNSYFSYWYVSRRTAWFHFVI